MKKSGRGFFVYIAAFVLLFIMAWSFINPQESNDYEEVAYSEFTQRVEDGGISQIKVVGTTLYALKTGSEISSTDFPERFDITTKVPSQETLNSDLKDIAIAKGTTVNQIVNVEYEEEPGESIWVSFLRGWLPLIVLMLLLFFFFRQSQNSNSKAMSFGKSQAHLHVGNGNRTTFDDVAGADEEKQELEEIVDFLKNPERFTKIGARIPKGVLLVGPPGTGKTLLAKAVAGEADVPFFSISGSDFVEMFVGVGASRVRDMFRNAKKNSPCIIFIDEIDAVGRHRGAGLGGGHDEREQTLNQLLTEMDGFEVNEGIIILAATNRRDILDPALLRPGRFDRQVVVNLPDVKGREEIFKVHARNKPMEDEVDFKSLARSTVGSTGADIENILNEAAILSARANKKKIGTAAIQEAIMKVMLGPEKKSRLVTERDQEITAYHEVGHAICARVLPNCDDVHEISIISRGMAAGYTLTLPEDDKMHITKGKLLDELAMMLGGRVAEEVMVGDISTGATSDLQRATEVARKMVINFGMSEEIGTLFLGSGEEIFLGKEYGHTKNYSESLAAKVDVEISKILKTAHERAHEIITSNKDKVETITRALIEREKLDREEFALIFEGKALPPMKVAASKPEPEKKQKVEKEVPEPETIKPVDRVQPQE